MKAILDRVFIKRDDYQGQIIVNQKMCTGTIVSVGPGIWRGNLDNAQQLKERKLVEHWYPTSLKIGQRVCFSLDKGEEHEMEGQKITVMREWDIAGVIEDNSGEIAA